MTNRTCHNCEAPMTHRCIEQRTVIGGITVTNRSAMGWSCSACNETEVSLEQARIAEIQAVALIIRDGTHITDKNVGTILRFARKAIGMIQTELAGALDITAETVSRWESGGASVPKVTQLAILALLDAAAQGKPLLGPSASCDTDAPRIETQAA